MKASLFTLLVLMLISTVASRSSAQTLADHALAPGDSITIQVYDEPDLNLTTTIGKDGGVSLHLAGDITVTGQTAAEAAKAIERAYTERRYLVKPRVTVTIASIVRQRFSVQGQVTKPGPYFFPDGERVTVLQAIGFAGGFTRIASASKVTIIRGAQTIKVDAKKLAKEGGEPIYLLPGDVVNVPEGW